MEEDVQQLEQTVVIGYGTQRRSDVTGSIVSVNAETMKEVPAGDITYALQGRAAGVDMAQTSTKPGSSLQIRIRGARSLSATNDPLIVLDGIPFPGGISDINPNDVKSIDILKDAASTAIYGSRGANGVIMITTMGSDRGIQKPRITYNGYIGIKDVFAKYPMMNGSEFVELRKAAGKYTTNGADEDTKVNTDWQDLLYVTGLTTSHDVSIAGNTTKGFYNFGLGYYRDEAVVPTQNFSRISLRGSFDQEIGKYLRFGITTNNSYGMLNGMQIGLYNTLSSTPIANPYNEDGSLKRVIRMPLDTYWVQTKDVIESLEDQWLNETKFFGSYNNIYGEVKIPGIEGLKYKINVGLNMRTSNGGSYTGMGIGSENPETLSSASISNSFYFSWLIENLITYDRTFAEKHKLNVVGLFSAEQATNKSTYVSARGVPADFFQYYNLGKAEQANISFDPNAQGYTQDGLLSKMLRVTYQYDNRYMLLASYRNDGSSHLAPGHKYINYYGVSAGWNIRNESFMQNIDWMSQLKLRVGYGMTSNQSIAAYETLGTLTERAYNFGSDYVTGLYVTGIANPNLGWEFSDTWNFGVDFSLFKNRLNGTVEYYIQNTHDLLMTLNLPPTAGVSSFMGNIGKTQNKGFELSLNGIILQNHNGWTWDAGINIYSNHNKIVELASGQQRDITNSWFVGHSIDAIYDYKYIGLWQEGDPYLDILEPGGNVGMIKVEYTGDYNADGTPTRAIGADDRQVQDVESDFQGGFNTRLSYKGFDLNIVGAFKSGGLLLATLYAGGTSYLNLMDGRRGNVKVDYWTETNTGARYPKPGGVNSNDVPKYASTLGYFSASYLKVRAITLGYTIDQNLSKKLGVERLRLYFTLQNPFVLFSPFHNETGLDPETNSYGNENVASNALNSRLLTVGFNTPSTRNYIFGINLTF
jgi:TonB-linked SusC/RagA family outer membrane protein